MKYIDTNVLVRVITGDDQHLATQAIAEIQRGGQNEFYVLDAILVELCFVLEFHAYKMTRNDIAASLSALIATPQIMVAETSLRALELYEKNPKLDYADCLLWATGGRNGVFTFDSDLSKALLR
jgi:predicted nucleic-acid-binding protein